MKPDELAEHCQERMEHYAREAVQNSTTRAFETDAIALAATYATVLTALHRILDKE